MPGDPRELSHPREQSPAPEQRDAPEQSASFQAIGTTIEVVVDEPDALERATEWFGPKSQRSTRPPADSERTAS